MKVHVAMCKNRHLPITFEKKMYCALNVFSLWRYEFIALEKRDMKYTLLIWICLAETFLRIKSK